MASDTMRENSISRKVSQDRPANPLVGLRDFVQRRHPESYRLSCDYLVEGRMIIRVKRFLGTIVDRRPIGELPDGIYAVRIFVEDFDGVVLGDKESIERITRLESQFWSVANQIVGMFTLPCPVNIPTSRLGGGAV